MSFDIHIIGGGLAGSEAAWQLAEAGLKVRLSEMRGGGDTTPAHETDRLAEMVCSNSFRSDDAENNAVGLIHQEMRRLGSLIMASADAAPRSRRIGAGGRPRRVRREVTGRIAAASASRDRPRAGRRFARSPRDHRHRPADRLRAGRRDRRAKPARTPRLLRRHRADRPPRQHRHGRLLDGRPVGQGRQGLHQLPDGQGAVRRLRRGLERRREDPSSRSGRRTRPISRAACRSRSWPSAGSKPCATGR